MATTYQFITSTILSTTATSVTFSSVPQTFTDLVIKATYRSSAASAFGANPFVRFNSDSSSLYSYIFLQGNGSGLSTGTQNEINLATMQSSTTAGNTANTFTSNELYISNYTGTLVKPFSQYKTAENQSTNNETHVFASLYRGTSPITTITFGISGSNFIADSSFYLYGIKNT
jgi:hypothetical protein